MAYRLLLGREAESRQVVTGLMTLGTLEALREAMLNSVEFQSNIGRMLSQSGSKWVAVDVLDRFTQWIDLHDRHVSRDRFHGNFEPDETAYFISRLHAGDTVLDIGANTGWFTLLAAKHTGKSGRIHSFEPRPEIARMLKRTVSDNELGGRVTVWEYALEDAWQRLPAGKATGPLDEILPDIAPDLIRIAIKGAEPLALKGAAKAISRRRPAILTELRPDFLQSVSAATPAQYIEQMGRLGYACFLLENGVPTRKLTDFPADKGRGKVSAVFECTGPFPTSRRDALA